jgi:CRP-like cAMP-binding protein
MAKGESDCDALLKRLSCFAHLSDEDRAAISGACEGTRRRLKAKTDLFRQGDRIATVNILSTGWSCRLMTLPDGRRQIAGFLVPGDICKTDISGVSLDYSMAAITDSVYLQIPRVAFERLPREYPSIGEALAIHDHVASSILRNWVLNLGQRNAFERIGHLFCELLVRLRCIGQAQEDRFHLPVTQIELAEATGLTPVHVNRTIQDLRARELVSLQNRELRILDFDRLADLVMFDGDYLHPVGTGSEAHAETH